MGNASPGVMSQWVLVASAPLATNTATNGASIPPSGHAQISPAALPFTTAISVEANVSPLHGRAAEEQRPVQGTVRAVSQSEVQRTVPDVLSPVPAQLKWLATPAGQEYLARQPVLLQMFFDETLHRIMYRPD